MGPGHRRLLGWLPPSAAQLIYTVLLRPRLLRALAHFVIRQLIPPTVRVDGTDVALNPDDAVVSGALALGCYDRSDLNMLKRLLLPGMCVVDVGANVGLYAAAAGRAVAPAGVVYAIEPDVQNCIFLRRTLALNALSNVHVVEAALSDRSGPGQLFLCASNKGDHRIHDRGGTRPAVTVELVTLDDLVRRDRIPPIDVLKLDVQGAEELVLAGMRRTLAEMPQIRLLMEFWPWGILQAGGDPGRLLRDLRRWGFEINRLDADSGRMETVTCDMALATQVLERRHFNLLVQRQRRDLRTSGQPIGR